MTRLPIRVRVTAAFAVAMSAVLAASGWFLYARLGSHLSVALDRDLRVRAQDVSALVARPGSSLAGDSAPRLVEQGESYAELLDGSGRVLDATRALGRHVLLTTPELRAALQRPIYRDRGAVPGLNESSRLLATPVERRGRRLVLVVGNTLSDRSETLVSFRDELVVAGPAALVLACIAGYLLAGLSLRQVEAMRRRAAAISAETPGERLPVPPTHDEVARLGETLNEMLARLEDALRRERAFVADAGHELRTPLALLKTELELALRQGRSADELRDAVRRSVEETDRLTQLSEDLLLIARSEQGRLPLRDEEIAVPELLGAVVARFAWRAREAGRMLEGGAPEGLRLVGDRLRLEQALGNLVDNALRYGDGEVQLTASAANGTVALHVRDEGDGFPPDLVEHAFERFVRGDPARGRAGAGLGLSIVRTIAEAHGGGALAENRRPRGADVWVTLPATGP